MQMTAANNGSRVFRTLESLVLASSSPRRKELLEGLGLSFDVVPSGIDETLVPGEPPPDQAARWASEKASAVSTFLPDRWVIAADTIVVLEGSILGKPADSGSAASMLRRLSGRRHEVMSGICLMNRTRGFSRAKSVVTEVEFKGLTEEEIDAYVRTGEPLDKAGAYGIQGVGAFLVRSVCGSYTNVVGLPLCETLEWLVETGEAAPLRQ
jgi:septum formation protein